MKLKMPWRRNKENDELSILEARLDELLQPVEPRKEFVDSLRNKLVGKPAPKFFGLEISKPEAGLVVVGGIFSGILLLVSGVRAILMIAGMFGLIKEFNNKQTKVSTAV